MKKFSYIFLALLGLFFSCEQVVVLDLNQAQPQLVIEGMLTNMDTTHYVKVSQSIQFYETELSPVLNAIIKVEGGGNEFLYSHNPMEIDSLNGYYFSDLSFAGSVGEAYRLQVTINGVSYTAIDTMRNVTPIDSLSFRLASHPSDEDEADGKIYEALLFANEPPNTEDYYQFQFFRDRILITYPDNLYVFSDELIGPNLNGLPSPVLFREGELAGVQILSLGREQYVFYTDLANLLNSDGGMFSPPPANPRNTFTNNALGLWQVSAVSTGSIRIDP